MNTLVLRLKEKVLDETLLKMGEMVFPVYFTRDDKTVTKVQLAPNNIQFSLEIQGPACFYTDYEATQSMGKYVEDYSVQGIYFKPDYMAEDGEITIKITNAHKLVIFGNDYDWNPVNTIFLPNGGGRVGYYLAINSSQLMFMPALRSIPQGVVLNLESTDHLATSLLYSFLPSYINIIGSKTEIDINKIGNNTLETTSISGVFKNSQSFTYTGNLALLKKPTNIEITSRSNFTYQGKGILDSLNVLNIPGNTTLSTEETDNLLIDLDAARKSIAEVSINGRRSSKSDAAVTSLLKKVVKFYINGAIPVATV